MRRQQDGVIACRIQFAVSAVDDARLRQDGARFGLEIADEEFVLFGVGVGEEAGEQKQKWEKTAEQRHW